MEDNKTMIVLSFLHVCSFRVSGFFSFLLTPVIFRVFQPVLRVFRSLRFSFFSGKEFPLFFRNPAPVSGIEPESGGKTPDCVVHFGSRVSGRDA